MQSARQTTCQGQSCNVGDRKDVGTRSADDVGGDEEKDKGKGDAMRLYKRSDTRRLAVSLPFAFCIFSLSCPLVTSVGITPGSKFMRLNQLSHEKILSWIMV